MINKKIPKKTFWKHRKSINQYEQWNRQRRSGKIIYFTEFMRRKKHPYTYLLCTLEKNIFSRNQQRLRSIGSIVSADAEQYVTPRKQQVQKRSIFRGVRSEKVRVRVSPDVGIVAHVDIFERHFFRQFGEVPQFDRAVERPLNLESRILCKNYRSKWKNAQL